jgi:raffinose/stachyose/melibiose transport system permease protein
VTTFRYTWRTFSREILFLLGAALFCVPFYMLLTMSLKTNSEIFTAPLSLPKSPAWGNFPDAVDVGVVPLDHAALSSVIITAGSVFFLIVIGSFCAYAIARTTSRLGTVLYIAFVMGIVLPPQLAVVPLFVVMRNLGLVGTYPGMIILYVGLLTPLAVFLYAGFVRTLPRDFEEAAQVDGAGTIRTYVRVILPLMRPVTWTVAILTGLFVWNDFFTSLIFLSGSDKETVPVAVYSLVEAQAGRWNLAFAAIVLALLPAVLFYLIAQRQIVNGLAGGVKG